MEPNTKVQQLRTMPDCTIIPILSYPDFEEAVSWLSRVLGFKERWRIGDHRAQLAFGEGVIVVTKSQEEDTPRLSGQRLLLRVKDVDAHFEHARLLGAEIMAPPESH